MKCSKCKNDIMGLLKEDTRETYPWDGAPIVCLQCTRTKYKPGTIIETDFSMLDDPNELAAFNGIKGIVVRPLGCHEDLAGCLDYVISWDWTDDRLVEFLRVWRGNDLKAMLDPRIAMEFIREVKD